MTLVVLPATSTTAGGAKVFNQTSILATNVIAIGHTTTPYITAYPWAGGFGTKYNDPGSLPATASSACGVSFAPNGSAVALGRFTASTTNVTAYSWSSGFGTRYQGTTVSAQTRQAVFSPDSAYIAAAQDATPYIAVLPWSSSGFGTRVSDPGTTPTGAGYGVAFRPQNDAIVVAHATSPYTTAYPWSSSGFGTKYNDPGTAVAGIGYATWFTPTGSDVAISHATSPFVSVYSWSSGFGTKYGNPANVPPNSGTGVAFTRAGTTIAVASQTTSPYVAAYAWSSSGFGTKYADPGTAIGGSPAVNTGNKLAFAVDDSAIAIVHNTSPYISAYPWDTTNGFGTKYSDPGTAIAGTGNGVAFGTMFT